MTVQTLFADLRAEGHIVPSAEAEMIDEFESDPDQKLDAEIDLGDDDDPTLEAWDEVTPRHEGAASALGSGSDNSNGSPLLGSAYEIVVQGETCRLHIPTWAGFEPRSDFGQRVLDEFSNRLVVLARIADWLSETRKQFLVTADPWHLGCDAFKELRSGHVPVSEQSFLKMNKIDHLATSQTFSRYTRDCFLVWPDATAPLSILFDSRARQAWVGNIIKQFAEAQERKLTNADLKQLRSVTKPRTTNEKQKLTAASVDSLSFSEVLMRATLLANVGCSDVLAEYGECIIGK